MLHASHSAHVEGESGTFVLPARSSYDRQMLRDHVEHLATRCASLTLGLDGERWRVTHPSLAGTHCVTCRQFVGRLSCSRSDETTTSCIDCVIHAENHMSTERRVS